MKLIAELNTGPRAVLVTGKLIGEGFDLPDLATLVIALPITSTKAIQVALQALWHGISWVI